MALFSEVFVGARVYNNASISVNNATLTALTFNSERYDNDTIHDTSSNSGRLTCNTAGKYLIAGHIQWGDDATGFRLIAIRLNGTTYIGIHSHPAVANNATDNATYQSVSTIYDLSVGNYVELVVEQISGGALNVVSSGNFSPEFEMNRIG